MLELNNIYFFFAVFFFEAFFVAIQQHFVAIVKISFREIDLIER